jgi:acetoin utilization deacetylase AcuC-like enzyme
VNVPLYGGQGDGDYLYVFRELLLPLARAYAPELILVSAGFDTHRNDPLAGMAMSGGAYGKLAGILRDLSDECCPGRLALTLEGGYDHTALSDGVASVLSALIQGPQAQGGGNGGGGEPQSADRSGSAGTDGETRQVVQEVRRVLSPCWQRI